MRPECIKPDRSPMPRPAHFLFVVFALGAGNGFADEIPENERRLSELVESIVQAALPRTFEDRRHWDQTREVFAGVKVRTDGLQVRISKRKEAVRHGLWRKHTVTLPDPERSLSVRIRDVHANGGGQWTFVVTTDAKVNVKSRFEQWSVGVKLLNASSEADALVRIQARCSLVVSVEEHTEKGPVVVFAPDVERVDLYLRHLDVKKFGELRGDVAADLFDGLEDALEDLLQTQEDSVRRRARREISDRAEDLQIPLGTLLKSPWAALVLAQ